MSAPPGSPRSEQGRRRPCSRRGLPRVARLCYTITIPDWKPPARQRLQPASRSGPDDRRVALSRPAGPVPGGRRNRRPDGLRRRRRPGRASQDAGEGRLRPRRPPHPLRQLLRLPRPGRPVAQGVLAVRPARVRRRGAGRRRTRRRPRQRRRQRAGPPRFRRRQAPDAAAQDRQTPDASADLPTPSMDRRGRPLRRSLVLHPAGQGRAADGRRRRLAAQPHRPLHPGPRRGRRPGPGARGRQDHAHPPRHPRPHRPAADAGRGGRLPRGQRTRRLRKGGGPAAGVAALRRTHGPLLARRRPLRRHPRPPPRQLPRNLALPRLGHQRLQRKQAVRPVHRRAAGRRPAAQPHARPENRHRLHPLSRHHQRGRLH